MSGDRSDAQDMSTADMTQVPSATFKCGTDVNHEHVNAYPDSNTGGIGIETGGDIVQVADRFETFNFGTNAELPVEFIELS